MLYVPIIRTFLGYSADNGQALYEMNMCNSFECQQWRNNVAVAPKLVPDKRGFMVCPNCSIHYKLEKELE